MHLFRYCVLMFFLSGGTVTPLLVEAASDASSPSLDVTNEECAYNPAGVRFLVAESIAQYLPGQTLDIQGQVENTTAAPLAEGKILSRLLREDATYTAHNGDPVVAETLLPDTFSLPAHGAKPFHLSWKLPDSIPGSYYRLELFYLAGGRYPMAGDPTVIDFPGKTIRFAVSDAPAPQYFTFDRNAVALNQTPLSLYASPPTLALGAVLTIHVPLQFVGAAPAAVKVRSVLHPAGGRQVPAAREQEQTVTLQPGTALPVSFVWDNLDAESYQLVISATPEDSAIAPSLLTIPLIVSSSSSQLSYLGIAPNNGATAVTLQACAVSALAQTPPLKVRIVARSDDTILGQKETIVQPEIVATSVTVPGDAISGALTVVAELINEQGTVVDTDTARYDGELIPGLRVQTEKSSSIRFSRPSSFIVIALLIIVAAGSSIMFIVAHKRRRTVPQLSLAASVPPPPPPPPPPPVPPKKPLPPPPPPPPTSSYSSAV